MLDIEYGLAFLLQSLLRVQQGIFANPHDEDFLLLKADISVTVGDALFHAQRAGVDDQVARHLATDDALETCQRFYLAALAILTQTNHPSKIASMLHRARPALLQPAAPRQGSGTAIRVVRILTRASAHSTAPGAAVEQLLQALEASVDGQAGSGGGGGGESYLVEWSCIALEGLVEGAAGGDRARAATALFAAIEHPDADAFVALAACQV